MTTASPTTEPNPTSATAPLRPGTVALPYGFTAECQQTIQKALTTPGEHVLLIATRRLGTNEMELFVGKIDPRGTGGGAVALRWERRSPPFGSETSQATLLLADVQLVRIVTKREEVEAVTKGLPMSFTDHRDKEYPPRALTVTAPT
jgi:hypothetical protein